MFTEKQIKKMPRKNLTALQFAVLAKRLNPGERIVLKRLEATKNHGMFLGIHSFDGKKWYRLHLKSMWIKSFNLAYSAHKNIRVGKEIIISNMSLPPGPIKF